MSKVEYDIEKMAKVIERIKVIYRLNLIVIGSTNEHEIISNYLKKFTEELNDNINGIKDNILRCYLKCMEKKI